MLKINTIENLFNAKEMLKNYCNGQEVCLSEIKKLKTDYKNKHTENPTTTSIETLKRLGVLKKNNHTEEVVIKLKKPTTITKVFVNGQEVKKKLEWYDIKRLQDLKLNVKEVETEVTELHVTKQYYTIYPSYINAKLSNYKDSYPMTLEWTVKKLERDLKIYKKLMSEY